MGPSGLSSHYVLGWGRDLKCFFVGNDFDYNYNKSSNNFFVNIDIVSVLHFLYFCLKSPLTGTTKTSSKANIANLKVGSILYYISEPYFFVFYLKNIYTMLF